MGLPLLSPLVKCVEEARSPDVAVNLVRRIPPLPEVHRQVAGQPLQEEHEGHPHVVVVRPPGPARHPAVLGLVELALHLADGERPDAGVRLPRPVLFFRDGLGRPDDAAGALGPAVLLERVVQDVLVVEAGALDGLADDFLAESQEGRDEKEDGGRPKNTIGRLLEGLLHGIPNVPKRG